MRSAARRLAVLGVVTGVVSVKVELAGTSLTTETPMTDDTMRLLEIMQKSDDGDGTQGPAA